MDYLEQPGIKESYDKCKLIVKVWEHKFTKKYKRIPSKLDIREASRDVRNAYRKYFQLKTTALEQSFKGIEGFEDEDELDSFSLGLSQQSTVEEHCSTTIEEPAPDNETQKPSSPVQEKVEVAKDVWGPHLNHKKDENKGKPEQKANPNSSITKKLFCGSKFTKRNPRKSISFSSKTKSNININDGVSLSQPPSNNKNYSDIDISTSQPSLALSSFSSFDFDDALSQNENWLSKEPFQVKTGVDTGQIQPINVVQSVLENIYKPLKHVDPGWLQRVAQISGLSVNNQEKVDTNFPFRLTDKMGRTVTNQHVSSVGGNFSSNHFNNGMEQTKLDYDSDIIEESDEEVCPKDVSSLHVVKKRKIESFPQTQTITFDSSTTQEQPSANISDISDKVGQIQSQIDTDNCMDVEDYEKIVGRNKETEGENDCGVEKVVESVDTFENPVKILEEAVPKNRKANGQCRIPRRSKASTVKSMDKADQTDMLNDVCKQSEKIPANKIKTKSNGQSKKTLKKQRATSAKNISKLEKDQDPLLSPRRSTRVNRVKISLQELNSDEEEPFANDEELDPEFDPVSDGKKNYMGILNDSDEESTGCKDSGVTQKLSKRNKTLKTPKKRSALKKSLEPEQTLQKDEIEEETQKTYDLEFSVKPRIVKPRYRNLKDVLVSSKIKTKAVTTKPREETPKTSNEKPVTLVKDKRQQAKEGLLKKIASGNLNDNFVRIDIKKKIFVRGKSGKNFSKYKKSQWKAKKAKALAGPDMDMGGCDGGMLTCFNCGQIGHFARNCQATKGDGLLPMTAEMNEDESSIPTLEEASQMARGVLEIRAPLIVRKDDQNTESHESEAEEKCDDEEARVIDDENHFGDDEGFDNLLLAEALKLEEQVRKLDVQQYLDRVKFVEPYFPLNEDGSVIATPPEVFEVLNHFGHTSFRAGQEQAIMRILSGKSTLVTLSTGSGKSLCYQLPAYMYAQREPCISLIVSPLVSLMDDQITGIAKFMKAACLHSNQTKVQRQKILEMISGGELSVLLVSPEAVVAGERQMGFGSFLRKLPPIAFACIDEAHCVSQWSHNFRPSYLMICRVLRESLGVKTILGLTATATRATRESIIRHLCIPDGENGVISDIPLPDNLVLTASKDGERDYALLRLLMSERFSECKSIIVYCTRRDECERMAAFLRTSLKSDQPVLPTNKKRKRVNLQAEPYHAGLSASRRRTIQNSFMSGMLRIVVATVAFGMGINKSDIRAVIHYNMPNSFESYVQEVGRAGRDGLKAHCHVFLNSKGRDENELRRHIHANSIERHTIRKLLQKVFVPCSCSGVCSKHEVAFSIDSTVRALDIPEENISTLLCYLELHPNKYIELLSPAYTWCKIISYGGPLEIRKVAKDCPPLAMALALHKNKTDEDPNLLEFPVVEIASAMGWESGICKHKLKNLEWITVNNQPKRSPISVQLSDLGFRLLAPGNLSDDQLDEALDSLYNRVVDQEQKALLQLNAVHQTLSEVAKTSFKALDTEQDDCMLKKKIREYFNSSDPLSMYEPSGPKPVNEDQLVNDIHAIINLYRDNNFTGRAIARIFQGIQSPNYPAVMWGRCKFWRMYLDTDFHAIVKIATREIIKLR